MKVLYRRPDCWKCVEVEGGLDGAGASRSRPSRSVATRSRGAALVAAQGEPPQVPMLVDGGVAVWDRRPHPRLPPETYGAGPREGEPSYRDMPSFVGGTCRVDGGGAC